MMVLGPGLGTLAGTQDPMPLVPLRDQGWRVYCYELYHQLRCIADTSAPVNSVAVCCSRPVGARGALRAAQSCWRTRSAFSAVAVLRRNPSASLKGWPNTASTSARS